MDVPELLTLKEFCRRSPMSEKTVRRHVETGRLPSVQPGGEGGRIYIPADALTAGISGGTGVRPPEEPPVGSEPKAKPLAGPRPRWRSGSGG